MKIVDVSKWERKEHYYLFGAYEMPCFSVDVRLDMTKFMEWKSTCQGEGFFLPFLFLTMRALNQFYGFRLRHENGNVCEYDVISPSFTVSLPNGNFSFCRFDYTADFAQFVAKGKQVMESAKNAPSKKENFTTNDRADVCYVSCTPWIDIVALTNPLPLSDKMSMSIPRLNWGKCVNEYGGYKMTLSVTANHAFIDGLELSNFFICLQQMLDNVDEYIK